MPQKTQNQGRRRLPALVLAFALGLVGLVTASPVAKADEVKAIIPDSVKIIRTSQDSEIHLWSMVRVEADWAIPDGSGKAGDTFKLGLPEEFDGTAGTFNLEGRDGDSLVYGNCVLSDRDLTCTLNENVENKSDVGGSVWIDAQVVETTDHNKLTFNLGNQGSVEVPLPGDQGRIGYDKEIPTDLLKSGWFADDDHSMMNWQIAIPGAKIADRSKLEITDTFKMEGMDLTVADGYPEFFSSTLDPECWNIGKPDGCREVYDENTTPSFTYQIDEASDTVTATVDNKGQNFSADRIYVFMLRLHAPQNIPEGTKYVNNAKVDSVELRAEATKRIAGGGTGSGKALGHLTLKKAVTGDNAGAVPADTVFPVTYSYEVAGETKTGELSPTADGALVDLPNLPRGVVVTLTEKTPTIDGVDFGDPVFSGEGVTDGVPDGNSAQVTIQGDATVDVTLTNTVTPTTTKVTPVIPTVTPGVCPVDSTTPTPPTVTGAEDTDQIDYSEPEININGSEVTVTLTATPKDGFEIDTANLPEGWSVVDGVVTYSKTITQPACAVPVAPTIDWGKCVEGSTTPTPPTATVPETPGLTYSTPEIKVEGAKVTVTVTATAQSGYQIGGPLPEGWTRVDETTATFTATGEQPDCSAPNKTVTPVAPKITPGVCAPGSTTPTPPTVEVPNTPGLTYGKPMIEVIGNKVKITVTATPASGYTISADDLPDGWKLNQDGTATYTKTLTQATCETPKKPGPPKTGA